MVNFVCEKSSILHARCCSRSLGKENLSCGTATAAIGKILIAGSWSYLFGSIRSTSLVDNETINSFEWHTIVNSHIFEILTNNCKTLLTFSKTKRLLFQESLWFL